MATAEQSAVLPSPASRPSAFKAKENMEQRAGHLLFLGGTAYAAAYVLVGVAGLSLWGALLAIGGTLLVLMGLGFVALRSS